MEIAELADFIVFMKPESVYLTWGVRPTEMLYGSFPRMEYGWVGTKFESCAYPMTRVDAERLIEELKQKYGGEYEILVRVKSPVTLTPAV